MNPERLSYCPTCFSRFDGMSETALTFKIKALKKLGQKAYAQSVYDRFQKEYQQLYGEKYKENSLEE